MVLSKTYQLKKTEKYLKADEVEEHAGKYVEKNTKEPVIVSWDKMSKSKHNGIDPLEFLDKYGIDTTRLFILADQAPTSDKRCDHSSKLTVIQILTNYYIYQIMYILIIFSHTGNIKLAKSFMEDCKSF